MHCGNLCWIFANKTIDYIQAAINSLVYNSELNTIHMYIFVNSVIHNFDLNLYSSLYLHLSTIHSSFGTIHYSITRTSFDPLKRLLFTEYLLVYNYYYEVALTRKASDNHQNNP